jgi:hypothetical protein
MTFPRWFVWFMQAGACVAIVREWVDRRCGR